MTSTTPMKHLKLLTILLPLVATSCTTHFDDDPYTRVAPYCDYLLPRSEIYIEAADRGQYAILTPECREALLKELHFDESWGPDQELLKEKVLEAFQVLLAYPLKFPPKNKILNTAPYSIHADVVGILDPEAVGRGNYAENPVSGPKRYNQNVFNYVVNRIDVITHKPLGEGYLASYGNEGEFLFLKIDLLEIFQGVRRLNIPDLFWKEPDWNWRGLDPFYRAGILFHEGRHGDGISHTTKCGGEDCDVEYYGSYGAELSYYELLFHGSWNLETKDPVTGLSIPAVGGSDLKNMSARQCYILQARIFGETLHPDHAAMLAQSNSPCNGSAWWTREGALQAHGIDP